MQQHSPFSESAKDIDWDALGDIEFLSDLEGRDCGTSVISSDDPRSTGTTSHQSAQIPKKRPSKKKKQKCTYGARMKAEPSTRFEFLRKNAEASRRSRQNRLEKWAREGKLEEMKADEKIKKHKVYENRKQKYEGYSNKQRWELAKIKEKLGKGEASTEEEERLNAYIEKERLRDSQRRSRRRFKKAGDNA